MLEVGAVRLCQELPMIELESFQCYTLLKLELSDTQTQYILRRNEPNTNGIQAAFIRQYDDSIQKSIRYANQDISAEEFPIPDEL